MKLEKKNEDINIYLSRKSKLVNLPKTRFYFGNKGGEMIELILLISCLILKLFSLLHFSYQ